MEAILEKLLQSPKLALYVERLEKALADEKQRRMAFYDFIDENMKAEFINGEILVHSPVAKRHNAVTGMLYRLISTYAALHDAGFVGIEKIMISLTRNDYEPDICFFSKEKAAAFTEDQKLFPAPDWVVEVLSRSTEKMDRGVKFQDYEAHGVREYWIIDPEAEIVEQYVLEDDSYQLVLKSNNGTVAGHVLSGFLVPVRALFDEKANMQALAELLRGGSDY